MNDNQDEDYDLIKDGLESGRKKSFHMGDTESQTEEVEEEQKQIVAGDPEFNTHQDRDNKLIDTA